MGYRSRVRALSTLVVPAIALAGATVTSGATADPLLSEPRSTSYYAIHGGIAGVTLIGAPILDSLLMQPDAPPRIDEWFGFEASVNRNMSATAASLSDRLVLATVVTPAFAEIGSGVDRQLSNHAVVYGETMGIQLLLNVSVKQIARRARPYTHNPDPRVVEFRKGQGGDANLSFYSGHSSAAFAAAVAGSFLFAAKTDDPWSRRIVWFSEMGMAAATAHLRVRAGMHYYSDVIVGTLVGAGLGVAVPYAQGLRYRPRAEEYVAASSGFVIGALLPLFVSTTDVRLPWGNGAGATLQFAPWITPGAAGAITRGTF